jgi:hypothetical protein
VLRDFNGRVLAIVLLLEVNQIAGRAGFVSSVHRAIGHTSVGNGEFSGLESVRLYGSLDGMRGPQRE